MFSSLEHNPVLFSFAFVFFAELGDKTLYTLVVLAARNRALPVMLGGWAAFVVQGLIAVFLGSVLGGLPPSVVHWGTAGVFLGCGLWLLIKQGDGDVDRAPDGAVQASGWRQFLTAFVMVFLAEWGDATQIASAALVARWHAPLQVFLGATLGLWTGTVLAVGVGRLIGDKIPSHVMRRTAGTLFCIFGVLAFFRS